MPDGSIVLMGGFALEKINNSLRFVDVNDVWRSTDNGATWALVTADARLVPKGWPGECSDKGRQNCVNRRYSPV